MLEETLLQSPSATVVMEINQCEVVKLGISISFPALHRTFLDFKHVDSPIAMSDAYGGHCTMSALENRFRRVKVDARKIRDALTKGIDPGTLDLSDVPKLEGNEICKHFFSCQQSYIVPILAFAFIDLFLQKLLSSWVGTVTTRRSLGTCQIRSVP